MAVVAMGALVLADVLSGALRRFALRRGITDRPDPRKSHDRPMPYLGGVAITLATLVPICLLVRDWNARLAVLVVAGAVIAGLGLVDDIRSMGPLPRLLVEALAATMVVLTGGRIAAFGNWLDLLVTTLWIVVITNSFNLLDNMDGAAATVATVVAGFLAWAALLDGQWNLVLLMLALSAGCLGFLIHNWSPARMFMGDAGSLFIGFAISAGAVLIDLPGGPMSRIAEMLLVTFVATVDTCLVLISRYRAGRPLLTGGTDHISHRLRRLGLSVRQVTFALFAATLAPCLCCVLVTEQRLPGLAAFAGVTTAAVALICWLLRVPGYPMDVERREPVTQPIPARALSPDRY